MSTPYPLRLSQRVVQVCLGSGMLSFWAAATIRQQRTLVFLIALAVLLAGMGRLVSINQVGLPAPSAVWLGYLIPELPLPCIMFIAQSITNRATAS